MPLDLVRLGDRREDVADATELLLEFGRAPERRISVRRLESEVASLPGPYAPPEGGFLLGRRDGHPVACGGYRAMEDGCELKRIYVRPAWRGEGHGRTIVEALIREATTAGYRTMRLDTLPDFVAAAALYRSLGFRETGPFKDFGVPGLLYFERSL